MVCNYEYIICEYSPVLNYVELNQQFNQQPLVKLSKYLSPEDRVGFLNLKKENAYLFMIFLEINIISMPG